MKILTCALDLIFPPICGFCGEIQTKYICNRCEKIVDSISINKIDTYNDKYFSKHLYIFKYEDIIREKIINYKFENKVYLYRTFSEAIIRNKQNRDFIKQYDILIPVPIHKERKKQRGYNQSELITRIIADEVGSIKLQVNVLKKDKNIVAQSTLNKVKREENIKEVYKIVNSEKIKNKKVLILDDIYTTGSTVNECSKVLKEEGCKDVGVITIAKD